MNINEIEEYLHSLRKIIMEIPVKKGRILITGATGLIGSCAIDSLLLANKENGCDFKIYALSRDINKLQARFISNTNLIFVEQDINQEIVVPDLDYVIHSASNADPVSYAVNPVETILTNIIGTNNILKCASNSKARLLFTSTFEVYGSSSRTYFSENEFGSINTNLIRSCYPSSKQTAELLVKGYIDEYGLDAVIARLASIYGPTMLPTDSKAHAQFIRNAVNGENIVLKSKGQQVRTYCYVIDAVRGLFTILFKGHSGETYNVANKNSISTVADVATTLASIAGTTVEYALPSAVEAKGFSKPQNCVLDESKLEKLGWQGQYNLRDGLLDTYIIYKKLVNNNEHI